MQGLGFEAVLEEKKKEIDDIIEKWVPRSFSSSTLALMCGQPRYAYDVESATKAIAEPIWDILDRGGKRWRPVLLLLVAEALGAKLEEVKDLVAMCEVVHNGTLMVDDIEDDSKVRRGKPCVHLTYGVDVAINAGNAMYYLPTVIFRQLRGKVPDDRLLDGYEAYCGEMLNLHFGQGFDIWWHNGKKKPSEAEYLQMCAYKTGTLARLSARLSALFAGGTAEQVEALSKFAESIGVAFQIQDDILNLVGARLAETKGQYGEDIHEGKRTLMVLHCMDKAPPEDAKRLEEILNQHPTDQAVINEAIAIIEKHKSIDYARNFARTMIREAWEAVQQVLPASAAKDKLKAFADFLVEREI